MRLRSLLAVVLLCAAAQAQEQLGTIVFPNSGRPEAQAAFLRGMLLLHNFAYPQAAKSFAEAQKIDPNFALAYWGEAMTYNHPIWLEVSVDDGRRALQRATALKSSSNARERGYVEAVEALYGEGDKAARDHAYEKAMERLARAYPDDIEAQTFWALSILGTRARDETDPRKQIRAAAILENIFPTHLDHPGVLHYLIHSYDDPIHAPLGLRAARRYARVATSAPHALHMPSHIFLQLGMWDDAARSNEAAYVLSKQWVEREHAGSDKRDLHSLEWLQYIYLQQRRFDEARRLLDEVKRADNESEREHHAREAMQVRYAIETGDWNIVDSFDPHAPAQFIRGLKAVAEKQYAEAEKAVGVLAAANSDMHSSSRRAAEVERDMILALLSTARGEPKEGLRLAQLAIDAEAQMGLPSGPPDDFKPAHELYGELLLKAARPAEALDEFRASLARTPNRTLSLAGAARAAAASGDMVAAREYESALSSVVNAKASSSR